MVAKRKDFTQIALDVVRRATGELLNPLPPELVPEPRKRPEPKGIRAPKKQSGKKA